MTMPVVFFIMVRTNFGFTAFLFSSQGPVRDRQTDRQDTEYGLLTYYDGNIITKVTGRPTGFYARKQLLL